MSNLKVVQCKRCKGNGTLICQRCYGNGVSYDWKSQCPRCKGVGEFQCPRCLGKGKLPSLLKTITEV